MICIIDYFKLLPLLGPVSAMNNCFIRKVMENVDDNSESIWKGKGKHPTCATRN